MNNEALRYSRDCFRDNCSISLDFFFMKDVFHKGIVPTVPIISSMPLARSCPRAPTGKCEKKINFCMILKLKIEIFGKLYCSW